MAESNRERPAASSRRKRLGASFYIAAILAVALLIFAGSRLKGWQEQRTESRVLILVNPWNYLDDSTYRPHLVSIGGGMKLDRSCASSLKKMLGDCSAAGYDAQVISAYRSREEQTQLFSDRVQQWIGEGMDADLAAEKAAKSIAAPGTSEHETGLAVDLADRAAPVLDESQANTGAQKWLMENSWRYGFVLRYPQRASEITGVPYEPWHYRYVGDAAAWQLYSLGITLEEYSSLFYSEEAEIVFDEAE